ncbi:MAG: hypothetical protein ABI675_28610 [Chitinophagaceae bacterium]
MRERKFLAGLATILIIGGIYCFRAAFSKTMPVKRATKMYLWLGGIICIGSGVFLVVKAFQLLSPVG